MDFDKIKTKSIRALSLSAIAVLLLAGCATSRLQKNDDGTPVSVESSPITENGDSKVLVEEIKAADAEIEPTPHTEVPLEINENVQKWIDYFAIKDRDRFRTFLERGMYYKETVQQILKDNEVPPELYYLAMIESGYVTHARSNQNAVGAWQFISATGKKYGLKNDRRYLDERRDIVRSTESASRFLKDLKERFGSWYLALASYNAGEGRIRRAIRKGKSQDFWTLVRKRALPRETMNYVPKFMAAVIIGHHPEKYGFTDLKSQKFPAVERAKVPSLVHLKEIAERADIPYEELERINPHLIRKITPRNLSSYEIWAPKGKASAIERLNSQYAHVSEPKFTPERRYASAKSSHRVRRVHRVRRGETLVSIAERYQLSVLQLKKLNRLRSNRIFRGQKLKLLAAR